MANKIVVIDPDALAQIIEASIDRALSAKTDEIKSAMSKLYAVKEWLTVDEAASYLGIARKTMMDWKDKYGINFEKRGQQLYFRRAELDHFIEKAA